MTSNQDLGTDAEELLEYLDYGVNIIDHHFNILFMNKTSQEVLEVTTSPSSSYKCHKLLFNNDNPCSDCPVKQIENSSNGHPENKGQIVDVLNTTGSPNYRIKYQKLPTGNYVQILSDVTRETELVRQVSLQSKETQAQNLILKRKRQTLEARTDFLDSIFNNILSGILVLNSTSDFTVTLTNTVFSSFINNEESLVNKKCYQIFGFQHECPRCPIHHSDQHTNWSDLRYHQTIGNYTLTESYAHLPDGKVLLTFEDNTKRVELLKQIKEYKEITEHQNKIFLSLLETSTHLQQTRKLEVLFEFTLTKLRELFTTMGFGLILNGERPEMIESAVFEHVTEKEKEFIIDHNLILLDPQKEETSLKNNTDQKPHALDTIAGLVDWVVLPMLGHDQKILGKFLIKGETIDQQSKEIISLFIEQVSGVAENMLLNRQLEKIANTDALTGVYNRGYFDRELERVYDNFTRFPNNHFTLLMIDVNGLKRINDVFGHQDGDKMIIKVAQLLTTVCRKTDIVTRLGGDEFAMLCPSTDYTKANVLLSRIREKESQTIMSCKHPDGEEEIIPIHVSIGIGSSEDTAPEEVLKLADSKMYEDKENYYANKERYR